ncbi:BAG family molecular chaperone regulator 3-like [Dorcoceras hygrometricum]|uniref:BAG family molecular chaperone regulator 3-like n=1 Tax=Dorcoceras hygrometricum TaxID=472368 RepID=A0A2Z7D9S5_9LAMI|nr:BAG family molecular chaperone regulator 3-like [Dorcoceras hygrometricum]
MNKAYMLKTRPRIPGASYPARGGVPEAAAGGWEVRPGGMFVQKRSKDSRNHVPNIKVIVKYGSSHHEIILSSQASFGELKKMVGGATGLHPQDQRLIFKDKERDSRAFLDVAGVKDGSKILLIEDELSKERRLVESRINATMEKASNDIAAIRFEVDKLAKQVTSIELEINGGKRVEDIILLNMIESLMIQLIKLDAISADGDVKLQRRTQVKRVQKYIEILDVLKVRNPSICKVQSQQQRKIYKGQLLPSFQEQRKQGNFTNNNNKGQLKWETF